VSLRPLRLLPALCAALALASLGLLGPTAASAAPPAPTLTTEAGPTINLGGATFDKATVSGGVSPGGSIVFTAYGPGDTTCTGRPAFVSGPSTVYGNGLPAVSSFFSPTEVGTYRWIAEYSGDANNGPVLSACNEPGQSVLVKSLPTMTAQASGSVPLGNQISDTVTLSGGASPTGQIRFTAYLSRGSVCDSLPVWSQPVAVNGAGRYTSTFRPQNGGVYQWVAEYSGDEANGGIQARCGEAGQKVNVVATPAMSARASGPVAVGATVTDSATLLGGAEPTGTLTFSAYGPDDPTCSSPAVFSKTVTVNGATSNYTSPEFRPARTGTYRWIAEYSGDEVNEPVTGTCNAEQQSVAVGKATPALAAEAGFRVELGKPTEDVATLSGLQMTTDGSMSGTLTFNLYSGGETSVCASTAPVYTKSVPVTANGQYRSGGFVPPALGFYRWAVEYSGDANDESVLGGCEAASQAVRVGKAQPLIAGSAGTTSVPPPAVARLGETLQDSVTVTGAAPLTGVLTFKLFGPADQLCTGTPLLESAPVAAEGAAAVRSPTYTPTTSGTYRWVVLYSGDPRNNTALTGCGDPSQATTVTKWRTTLFTEAKQSIFLGGSVTFGSGKVSASARLDEGEAPTGLITFRVYGPDDTSCMSPPIFTASVPVAGNGTYFSPELAPPVAGTYRFISEYSGDAVNQGTAGADVCGQVYARYDSVVVAKAATVTTLAAVPDPVPWNAPVTLTATVAGVGPTGSVTFRDDGVSLGSAPVDASGVASLTTSLSAGSHPLSAEYGGDANNLGGTSAVTAVESEGPPDEGGASDGSDSADSGGQPAPATGTGAEALPAGDRHDQGPGAAPEPTPHQHSSHPHAPPPADAPKIEVAVRSERGPAPGSKGAYRYLFRLDDGLPGSTFYCRMGGSPWKRCGSTVVYPHLTPGRHVLRVKAVTKDGVEAITTVRFTAGPTR
jgi:hypothetical protein